MRFKVCRVCAESKPQTQFYRPPLVHGACTRICAECLRAAVINPTYDAEAALPHPPLDKRIHTHAATVL